MLVRPSSSAPRLGTCHAAAGPEWCELALSPQTNFFTRVPPDSSGLLQEGRALFEVPSPGTIPAQVPGDVTRTGLYGALRLAVNHVELGTGRIPIPVLDLDLEVLLTPTGPHENCAGVYATQC